MYDLSEQIALVTGASRGIGQEISRQLAQAGAYVVGTATSEKGASNITATLQNQGGQGHGVVMNIEQRESIESALASLQQMPTILINNAGITQDNLLLRMQEEEWEQVLTVNLTGAYRLTKACLRAMLKQRAGRIINIGSVVGSIGNAGQANYAAAKAGLIGFTKSLAREIGSRGVTVNTVAPGFITTDMTKALSAEQQQQLTERIALQRLGTTTDIAHAVLFLASKAAGYITGETLHVNGGLFMN